MSSAQYLYRRPSGFYFVRLCVPARLKVAVGKGEIHRSTGCRDFRLAKIVAAELAAHWHRAIRALERMDIRKVKAGSIQLLGDGYVPVTEAAAALGATPLALATQLAATYNGRFFVHARGWLGWSAPDIDAAFDRVHDDIGQVEYVIDANRLGGHGAMTTFNGRLQIRFPEDAIEVLRANAPVPMCQFLIWPSRDRGFVCDLPGQAVDQTMIEVRKLDVEALREALAAQVTPEMLALAHPEITAAPATPGSASAAASTLFSTFMDEYLRRNAATWKPDQRRRREDQCRAFVELLGDVTMADIDRPMMRKLSDLIERVPDRRDLVRRKFECLTISFPDLIKLADANDLPRLTLQARQRMLDSYAEIFTWAERESYIARNPATGLGGELKKLPAYPKTKAHEQRDAMSDDDLTLIFSASWFATGTGTKTPKGQFYAYRPHYYWLPLLALFAGGRLNELSQLYLDDIKATDEGVAYLDFNLQGEGKLDVDDAERATDKSLKTISSERRVPVHQRLVDFGFLDYVAALRRAGHARLFPELKFDATKGYGKAAGKWFNERFLGNELKIPRNGRKTFHSMRHSFATALETAAVPSAAASDLLGHKRSGTQTETRYAKGASLETQKTYVDAIDYSLPKIAIFNVKDGLQAINDALALKSRHKPARR